MDECKPEVFERFVHQEYCFGEGAHHHLLNDGTSYCGEDARIAWATGNDISGSSGFGDGFDDGCIAWIVAYWDYDYKLHYFYKMPFSSTDENVRKKCGKIPWRFDPNYGYPSSSEKDAPCNLANWGKEDATEWVKGGC